MLALMMDRPLTLPSILDYGDSALNSASGLAAGNSRSRV